MKRKILSKALALIVSLSMAIGKPVVLSMNDQTAGMVDENDALWTRGRRDSDMMGNSLPDGAPKDTRAFGGNGSRLWGACARRRSAPRPAVPLPPPFKPSAPGVHRERIPADSWTAARPVWSIRMSLAEAYNPTHQGDGQWSGDPLRRGQRHGHQNRRLPLGVGQ